MALRRKESINSEFFSQEGGLEYPQTPTTPNGINGFKRFCRQISHHFCKSNEK